MEIIPLAYDHFAEGESPEPPFICYLLLGSDNFAADGRVYFKINEVRIELYTDKKDVSVEKQVEDEEGGMMLMFDAEELKWVDTKYFTIIARDDYDLTIRSNNTGHYWYLHNSEQGVLILFYRHSGNDPYHYQRRESTVHTAVRYIRKHDRFQMNGRKWKRA